MQISVNILRSCEYQYVYCIDWTAVYCGRAFFNSPSLTDKVIDFSKEPAAHVRDDRYMLLREYAQEITNKLFQINKGLYAAN